MFAVYTPWHKVIDERRPLMAQLPGGSLAEALLRAAELLGAVIRDGRSASRLFDGMPANEARGQTQDLVYFGLRHWRRGQFLVRRLTDGKTLTPALLDDFLSLSLALLSAPPPLKYEPHVLTHQAVEAAQAHPALARGKGLVNACLRRFLREREMLLAAVQAEPATRWNYPEWWIDKLRSQHPTAWERLLEQGNAKPPLILRVNRRSQPRDDWLQSRRAAGLTDLEPIGEDGIRLAQALPVDAIPGFAQGEVSVQDSGAQQAAHLLDLRPGMRVLDACAAPGGKTGHILELADVDLLALDHDARRLQRVEDNLRRLHLLDGRVRLQMADACSPMTWWDGVGFDAVLADVPCSGSGVIRRHPDIRWLRSPRDVANLCQTQQQMLAALWPAVKPGGTLLLVTCSVFLEEGEHLAASFLRAHSDALPRPAPGYLLPRSSKTDIEPDGFFYARFTKRV